MKLPVAILIRGIQGYGFETIDHFVLKIDGKEIMNIYGVDCSYFPTPIFIQKEHEFEIEPSSLILHSEIVLLKENDV